MKLAHSSALLMLAVAVMGCASTSRTSLTMVDQHGHPGTALSVYLIRHGWHTGLAVPRCQISEQDWPESVVFHDAEFVEIGWGDEGFYRAKFMGPLVVANAAFLPSRSAIHVTGIHQPLETFFPDSQILEIPISPSRMRSLCRFIHESYAHDEHGGPIYLGPALYGFGGFYQSRGHYFIPNTCNVWTARALAAAKYPIVVPMCTLAPGVVWQARQFGSEIQRAASVLPVIYPFFNFERPGHYEFSGTNGR